MEIKTVLKLADKLNERIVGQQHALESIAQGIHFFHSFARPRRPAPRPSASSCSLARPWRQPKPEAAMALADTLYGGDLA